MIVIACLFAGAAVCVATYYALRAADQDVVAEDGLNDNQVLDGEELNESQASSTTADSTSSTTTTTTTTTSVTFTGSECESTLATYCAPLLTRDWMEWCNSQIEAWRAVGVEAINPCANSKYAKDSCMEATILSGKDVPEACLDYNYALNNSSAEVQKHCLYTTRPGGVCEGVKPAPVKPGTAPEDVVVPFDDCLKEHYATLTAECQVALDVHTAVSKSTTR